VLKDIEGLSLKEIGDVTGMSIPAVKSNLHRARLFLREKLAEFVDGTKK
jgi:RNA polymerase sigma-70 factor (ECF subfamily)